MTKIIQDGPDIPSHLLLAHERGEVVFFCGAGISHPRLPLFGDLVKRLYDGVGMPMEGSAKDWFDKQHYDYVVRKLEGRISDGRRVVRETLADILTTPPNAVSATHSALLDLARNGDGAEGEMRIVTTNFDRLFVSAAAGRKNIKFHNAPSVPYPQKHWKGVVHLHGLLPEQKKDYGADDLNHLIISDRDLGDAYMNHQWAARFVNELLRNYTVCFVGYSVNDPVMRYLTAARADDNTDDNDRHRMYVFDECVKDEEDIRRDEWKAEKGITPILYGKSRGHTLLHNTLHEWACIHKRGKQTIIHQYAASAKNAEDNFSAQKMLWAITDPRAAKYFSDFNPAPPLNWLRLFDSNVLKRDDMPRFGCETSAIPKNQSFSVVNHPTPCQSAPWTTFAYPAHPDSAWEIGNLMWPLSDWLLRHLNNPELIRWLAQKGGRLHRTFARNVETRMHQISKRENAGDKTALDKIRDASPDGVPTPAMRVWWRLLLSGQMVRDDYRAELWGWGDQLQNGGLSTSLRLRLREMLSPCIVINGVRGENDTPESRNKINDARDIFDWQIKLRARQARIGFTVQDWYNEKCWQDAQPILLDDFTGLLRNALDLRRELGDANDKTDDSHNAMWPWSVSQYSLNHDAPSWTTLVAFARDAWMTARISADKSDREHALCIAENWHKTPYPIFKRLALFAATYNDIVPVRLALDWLLADDGWWLKAEETQRECSDLIIALERGRKLSEEQERELTGAIMKNNGIALSEKAQAKLKRLIKKYNWPVNYAESGEINCVTGDLLRDDYEHPPTNRDGLVEWLKKYPKPHNRYSDNDVWWKYCRGNIETVIDAWEVFPERWPVRFQSALDAWREVGFLEKSWRVAPILFRANDDDFCQVAYSVAYWLREQGPKISDEDGRLFYGLVKRVIRLEHGEDNRCVASATAGLLRWIFRGENPQWDGDIRDFLSSLCSPNLVKFRDARRTIASYAPALFRADPEWTEKHLSPLFDWKKSQDEAHVAWQGFLRTPYRLLLFPGIRCPFLETARPENYAKLRGGVERLYVNALTLSALHPGEVFSKEDYKRATAYFLQEKSKTALLHAVETILHKLQRAGENRAECWSNNVAPYFKFVWPPHREAVTPEISLVISEICTEAGNNFPDAVQQLRRYLKKGDDLGGVSYGLSRDEHKLCKEFPGAALCLLHAITGQTLNFWSANDLQELLTKIRQAKPGVEESQKFIDLEKICEENKL